MWNCSVRDGYEPTAWVLWDTGITADGHKYRVVISRQSDIRSPRILKDLELACLLYCRLNLVAHNSKVTQILYSTCLLICPHGAITMAGERKDLQQNKQLSLPTSVEEIAKRSDLPFKLGLMKLLKI